MPELWPVPIELNKGDVMSVLVTADAVEFGRHYKQGGWRLGLLVARNVKPGRAGRRSKNRSHVNDSEPKDTKVTQAEFARLAGVSTATISYYYQAWELQANESRYPHAEELQPGQEELDDYFTEEDEEDRLSWLKYMKKVRNPDKPKSSRKPKAPQHNSSTTTEIQSSEEESSEDEDEDETVEDEIDLEAGVLDPPWEEDEGEEYSEEFIPSNRVDILLEIKEAIKANIERLKELGDSQDDKEAELMSEIKEMLSGDDN